MTHLPYTVTARRQGHEPIRTGIIARGPAPSPYRQDLQAKTLGDTFGLQLNTQSSISALVGDG